MTVLNWPLSIRFTLNLFQGFGAITGKALSLHMEIDKITFTGSNNVGRLIMIYLYAVELKEILPEKTVAINRICDQCLETGVMEVLRSRYM